MNLPARRNRALRGMGDDTATISFFGTPVVDNQVSDNADDAPYASPTVKSSSGMTTNTVIALLGVGAVILLFATKR